METCFKMDLTTANKLLDTHRGYQVNKYTWYEDMFFNLLSQFIKHNVKIHRQYKLGEYRIDFYVPELNIVVEYDEDQHGGSRHKLADELRDLEIYSFLKNNGKGICKLYRVKKGYEGEFLHLLASDLGSPIKI